MNGPHRSTEDPALIVFSTGCSMSVLKPRGVPHNICLSFENEGLHLGSANPAYFGETIGRVANRISGARLDDLNGRSYQLPANGDEGMNTLHGGPGGWGKKEWRGPYFEQRQDSAGRTRPNAQKYTYLSPHGDEGFPGAVEARVWWLVWEEGTSLIVEIEFEVEMLDDQPAGVEETVVAMTNHSYFNLGPGPSDVADKPSIGGSILRLGSTEFLSMDPERNIPTGQIEKLPRESLIPENKEFVVGHNVPKLDHCFVLTPPGDVPLDTRSQPMKLCASFMNPESAVYLEVLTTEPAVQIYTGEDIEIVTEDVHWGPRSGIAVEPGRYTNAVNRPEWKHMVLLRKGQVYGSRIRYETWREAEERSIA